MRPFLLQVKIAMTREKLKRTLISTYLNLFSLLKFIIEISNRHLRDPIGI